MSVAILAALGVVIAGCAVMVWTGCAQMAASPGSQARCVGHVAPGALVLIGLFALAGLGMWADKPSIAWPPALVALVGSIVFMFSLGWFVFPALATCLLVGSWTLARPESRRALHDRGRLTRSTVIAVMVFWAVCLLYFWQPFTGLFLIVAGIAAALALLAFAISMAPRALVED